MFMSSVCMNISATSTARKKADSMILSERDGETNRKLTQDAIEYGIVAKSVGQTYVKTMLRDSIFPEG